MLDEIELFILRGGPEVLSLVARAFFVEVAFFADDRDTAFLAEGWIGEDQAEAFTRITGPRVGTGLDWKRVTVHAVQKEIHHPQANRIGNQFPAADKAGLQMPLLILVHVVMFDDEINRFEQEAAGWIADGIVGSRLDAFDDRFDEFARRKVLSRALGAFAGTLFEQPNLLLKVDTPFLVSACMLDQFSVSISSTIKRRSVAGFWISCRAFFKIAPSIANLILRLFPFLPSSPSWHTRTFFRNLFHFINVF
ncbi:hypothetical protein [Neorhodopirellula lusitana]